MSRLHHSFSASLRALQMSRISLSIFVEGKETDPNFFGQVSRIACEPRAISYRVQLARELPGQSEGKTQLKSFYRYARQRDLLYSTLNGKVSILLFFLDKDVDDIRRTKCRSPHVIYTTHYDVQNYVFRNGDFVRSVSAAASIDPQELAAHPLFRGNWCESAARRWKEWIVLCLFSVLFSGGRGGNYHNASGVNTPQNGPLDPNLYQTELAEAQLHSGLMQMEFDRAINRLTTIVERHLLAGTYDVVFKGKWYATLLEMDLRTAFRDRGQMQNVGNRATATMLTTLDFRQNWAEHLVGAVVNLLDNH